MFDNFPLWPVGASSNAGIVDAFFVFMLIVTGLVTAAIFVIILVFVAKYRSRHGHRAAIAAFHAGNQRGVFEKHAVRAGADRHPGLPGSA